VLPVVFTAVGTVLGIRSHAPFDIPNDFIINCALTLPVGYCAEFFFGIPVWWVFKRYTISSPLGFAGAGFVIGCAVALALATKRTDSFSLDWIFYGISSFSGLIIALVFRAVSFHR
jgi:hypothetical protein